VRLLIKSCFSPPLRLESFDASSSLRPEPAAAGATPKNFHPRNSKEDFTLTLASINKLFISTKFEYKIRWDNFFIQAG